MDSHGRWCACVCAVANAHAILACEPAYFCGPGCMMQDCAGANRGRVLEKGRCKCKHAVRQERALGVERRICTSMTRLPALHRRSD
eukprot:6191780-Pleurochrysis_carterae.AAC.3